MLPQFDLGICPAGNMQGALGVKPESHVFVGSKASWFDITDRVPQFAELPPRA